VRLSRRRAVKLARVVARSLLTDALALAPADRLELIDRLWDSLQTDAGAFPLTDEQRATLDRRGAEMKAHAQLGWSWEDVRARAWPKK